MHLNWKSLGLFFLLMTHEFSSVVKAGRHHGGHSNLASILAAGLVVQLLSQGLGKHHHGHHHGHHHEEHGHHESRHAPMGLLPQVTNHGQETGYYNRILMPYAPGSNMLHLETGYHPYAMPRPPAMLAVPHPQPMESMYNPNQVYYQQHYWK